MVNEKGFFTIYYKGAYINGNTKNAFCTVAGAHNICSKKQFSTLRAAQMAITKADKVKKGYYA